ncbi:MAG: ATP-binding protein, partial [Thermomicrobiales bacterium]
DWADRVLWESHLYGAYHRIYPWLTRDLPVPFRLENGVRVDESEQHRGLREALVNMLVHADFAERAASLILRWDGGVLFRNPGRSRIPSPGFHGGNRSEPRNPTLLRMFRRIRLAEEAGTGVPRIFRAWRELGYEPPQIDPGNEFYEFAITLPYEHLLSDEDRAWLAEFGAFFTEAEQLALVIARHEEAVDNQALRSITALHGADASRVLTGLRDRGFLDMVGSKRGAWYRLAVATPLLVDGGVSSGPSTTDSGLSSADSELSTTDSGLSSGSSLSHEDVPPLIDEELLSIAATVRGRKRTSPDRLAETIVELCAVRPLSLRELMNLLQRSEQHMRATLGALEDAGRIQTLYPQRQHPRQKYVATPDRSSRS